MVLPDENSGSSIDPLTIGIARVEARGDEPTHRIPTVTPLEVTPLDTLTRALDPPFENATAETRRQRHDAEPLRAPAPTVLRALVVSLVLVALAGVVGFVALHVEPSWFSSLSRNGTNGTTATTTVNTPKAVRPATHRALPIPNGTSPFISAIQPSSGVAGQSITISGARLVSGDGSIVAMFGNAYAATACRSEQQCIVTVPSNASRQSSALVRLRTALGYSNGVMFRYR